MSVVHDDELRVLLFGLSTRLMIDILHDRRWKYRAYVPLVDKRRRQEFVVFASPLNPVAHWELVG